MNGIRRAALFTSVDRYATLAVNFLTVMAVSRLLTPEEVGIVAIGAAILAFAEASRDVITSYLIQKTDVDKTDLRTATTVMMVATLIAIVLFNVLAGPIAHFANEPRLELLMRLISVSLLAAPIERPILAMVRRDMDFGALALVNLATVTTSTVTIIALAATGWGHESFGWACITGGIATIALSVLLRPQYLALKPCLIGYRSLLTFAFYGNACGILNQINKMYPSIIIARAVSVTGVGVFNRSHTVSLLPAKAILSAISPVVLPAFSQHVRNGQDLKAPALRMFELLAAVMSPALVMLTLLATPIVAVLLGPQWEHVVPYVQIIAMASLPTFIMPAAHSLLVAVGAVHQTTRMMLYFVPISLVIITIAAYISLTAVACSLFVTYFLQAFFSLRALKAELDLPYLDVVDACMKSLPMVGAGAGGTILAAWLLNGSLALSIPEGFIAGIVGVLFWLGALFLTKHPLWHEVEHFAGKLYELSAKRRVV